MGQETTKGTGNKKAATGKEIVELTIDQIIEPEIPTRTNINVEKYENLKESIKEVGILEPLLVKQREDRYEIISGHRRYLAGKELGYLSFPCIVLNTDDVQKYAIRMHTDLNREDINPADLAEMLVIFVKHLGLTIPDIAKRLSRSETWVRDHMNVARYPEKLREKLKTEELSFSVAHELSKINDPETLDMYTDMAVVGKITADTAREWVKNWKIEQAKKEKYATPEAREEAITQVAEPKGHCSGCQNLKPLDTMVRLPVCPECYMILCGLLRREVSSTQMSPKDQPMTISKETPS